MDIKNLSREEREALKVQLAEEEAQEKKRIDDERETYKVMVDVTTREVFNELSKVSEQLAAAKAKVFDAYKAIIDMKQELYGFKDTQRSHTFSTAEVDVSVTIGHRVIDDYDDTVDVGIAMVSEYVTSLATDAQSRALVETIMKLVQKDKKGKLNIGRVVQLEVLGEKLNNPSLKEAIGIIKQAYRPKRTRTFVDVNFKDEDGKQVSLPLSMSSVE